jgi:hypothetical protein
MKKKKVKKERKLKEENPVYVEIAFEEAMTSQRDILSYQMSLLNMVKSIKKYGLIREDELSLKINLQNMIKNLNDNIKKTTMNFPKVEWHRPKQKEVAEKVPKVEYYNEDLESQLAQIRKKLEEIGR